MMVPKFRAFIENLEEKPHGGHFLYGNIVEGETYDLIVGNLIEVTDDYINPEWWCSIKKGSAEQSTGVKDVNGKEIYENDIIVTHPKYDDEWPKRGIVQYGSCRAEFSYEVRKWDHRSIWVSNEYRTYEVIGNVHENPELLEAQHG